MEVHLLRNFFRLLDRRVRQPYGEALSCCHQGDRNSHLYTLIKLFVALRKGDGQPFLDVDWSHLVSPLRIPDSSFLHIMAETARNQR